MNRRILNEKKNCDPKFIERDCKRVAINKVIPMTPDSTAGQSRASTEVQSHVQNLKQSLKQTPGGQLVPVSAIDNLDGTYSLLDGNHRYYAIEELSADEGRAEDFQEILVYPVPVGTYLSSPSDKEDYQWDCNNHDVALSNTDADAAHLVARRMARGEITDAEGNAITAANYQDNCNNEKFLRKAAENLGVESRRLTQTMKAISRNTTNSRVKSWGWFQASKAYRADPSNNWEGKAPGKVSAGEAVYHLKDIQRITPNLVGNIIGRLMKDGTTKISVTAWMGDCAHSTGADVDEFRADVLRKINELNTFFKDGLGVPRDLIDGEVVFMPQKLGTNSKEQKLIGGGQNAATFAHRAKKVNGKYV